jgi:hypothetical protein
VIPASILAAPIALACLGAAENPPGPDLDSSDSALRPAIERATADRWSLARFYSEPLSKARRERLGAFHREWRSGLEAEDFGALTREGQVDYLLFKNYLDHEIRDLEIEADRQAEMAPLLPFAEPIVSLLEARAEVRPIDPKALARTLDEWADRVEEARHSAAGGPSDHDADDHEDDGDGARPPKKAVANRAAGAVDDLRRSLREWHGFYDGYDPLFAWWVGEPYKRLDEALKGYASHLRQRLVGVGEGDDRTIVGDPIGRDALMVELRSEMIPYTPEELVAIAEKELAWCEAEMKKAARAMGHGDDWKAALEEVKTRYVEPGEQPQLIKSLANEAIEFVEGRDLITVPALARQTWGMRMMSPEAQLRNPFFLGGESIIVSFPTNTMAHDDKMMSLRGNNRHFSRATVFHEVIPGHNLQQFMNARYKTYRRPFATPFWTEGWALYWEMLLWDLDFPKSPEDRVGMLFWRMHRCARIIFSLGFHLETMTPQECVDFLVDRVGHERANASAEVRRSFEGGYSPLYQCAYLIGGLQFRALRGELVESGRMTDRQFHDAILRLGGMPVEMVRASLRPELGLSEDFEPSWRFYDLEGE